MIDSGSSAWRLVRNALFRLDGERSHDLTVNALPVLRRTGVLSRLAGTRVHDPVRLMGLTFSNRIGMAAGLDKNAANLPALDALGFGFLEAGTVTPRPQPGNPKPRLYRLPAEKAVLNRMGFNNRGLDQFLTNVEQAVRQFEIGQHAGQSTADTGRRVLGLNIGKNSLTPIENATDDYLTGMRRVYSLADYITINISSPNTSNLRDLQRQDSLESLLDALAREREKLSERYARRVAIAVKIAPDLEPEQIRIIASTLPRHGIDAVIATNTTISRQGVENSPLANEAGGISGAPVRDMSTRVIAALRAELPKGFPIIGAGGILSAQDAIEKLDAGADLLQLYTGLIYTGPRLIRDCAQAARDYFGTTDAA